MPVCIWRLLSSPQYIPGVDSPDNLRTAQQAIDEYQKVIDANPFPRAKGE